jgi:hypothetical protein
VLFYLRLLGVATFTGIGGNFKMVWVATLLWNQWQPWSGIRMLTVEKMLQLAT